MNAEQRVRGIVDVFGDLVLAAGSDEILLANGSDHLPIEPELPQILAGLSGTFGAEFRIGRYDDHEPPSNELPIYEGELVGSRLQNVLRGVNSARIYLKQGTSAPSGGCSRSRRQPRYGGCATMRHLRRPTCGSPGATCCATTRTTRSAAARVTKYIETCSSVTSSSTGRSTMSNARPSGAAPRS